MKQGQDLQLRAAVKFLENIMSKEEDEKERDRVLGVMRRFEKTRDRNDLKGLNPLQGKMFVLLHDGFSNYKEAYAELAKQERFKPILESSFDVNEYLLSVQPNLNIDKNAISIDNLISKYFVNFLKLKKINDTWPKEFFTEWNAKSKEKMKRAAEKRLEKKKNDEPKPDKYYSDSDENESISQKPKPQPTPPPPPPPPPQVVYRQEREREPERKPPEKPRRVEPRQEVRTESARDIRSKLMEKYLQGKKDLHIERAKLRELAEYLAGRLEAFMKQSIDKIIDISCLKNKRYAKHQANEVAYFTSPDRPAPQAPIYFSNNSKVYVTLYKHKLEIYTALRIRELRKEDELRAALEATLVENEKKTDRRVENYVLKPRPKEVEPMVHYKDDPTRANIAITHFIAREHPIHFLETHRFLKNCLLLFNSYHY